MMTSRGLVVTETLEEDVGAVGGEQPPASDTSSATAVAPPDDKVADAGVPKRSPIAELLYMRWLEGLKIKWPSIL